MVGDADCVAESFGRSNIFCFIGSEAGIAATAGIFSGAPNFHGHTNHGVTLVFEYKRCDRGIDTATESNYNFHNKVGII